MGIDIAYLIRTGNVRSIPTVTFSEYIVASAEYFREDTDVRIGQAYFNTLHVIRPEIADRIRGTDLDAFYENDKLPVMLAEVYKRW